MTTAPETPSEPEFDFFISYTGADLAWAKWIDWQLMEAGYKTIAQYKDFQSGGDFVHNMQDASKKCKRVLSVYSPQYMQSEFCEAEWRPRFAQDPTGKDGLLLTVRIAKVEAQQAGLLASHTYIDLVGLSKEEAKQRLLERSQKIGPPTEEPPFPGEVPAKPQQTIPEPVRFPGDMPAVWIMPHQRNRNFSGRTKLLDALHQSLTSGHATALTAIHGMGGVGKTQTATEYAYRYSNEYDTVLWIAAEKPETLASDYAGLATDLQLPQQEIPNQEADIKAVKRWLNTHDKWLLILDNATDVEAVAAYLPNGNRGHVIITSRHPQWEDVATPISVSLWTSDEAIAFILKQTGEIDKAVAGELAEALGNLPLALAQATSYIKQTRIKVAKYLELFEADKQEMLKSGKAFLGYEAVVANVWNRSFEQVKMRSPLAASLLNLCAFLAPDTIPRDLLAQWKEINNEKALNDAIAVLLSYSLIEAPPENISVHRLVQSVTQDKLTQDEKRSYAEQAITLVDDAFPYNNDRVQTWKECAHLLPHVVAITNYTEALSIAPKKTGHLLNQVGLYLESIASFDTAKKTQERAILIGEIAYGKQHQIIATLINNLGSILRSQGDFQNAKIAFSKAISIGEATYGKQHQMMAIFINNLGGVLEDLGDFKGAKNAYERAITIGEVIHGKQHQIIATLVSNLGNVLRTLGDLQGAREALERATIIDEVIYGQQHPSIAIDANNLGNILTDLGDLQGAKQAYERAITIDEAIYGKHHPTIATLAHNLGSVLKDLGDLQGAKQALERAITIDEATYGKHHPAVARDLNSLGSILQKLRDIQGAKQAFEMAITIDEAVYGKEHPDVAIRVNNLGNILTDLGDLQGAKQAYERAFLIFQHFLGNEHSNTKLVRDSLNTVLAKLGGPPVE